MSEAIRKAYPSDLTDLQWEMVEMILPKPRRSKKGGRPQTVDVREVINTILYQCRSGCQWDMLPLRMRIRLDILASNPKRQLCHFQQHIRSWGITHHQILAHSHLRLQRCFQQCRDHSERTIAGRSSLNPENSCTQRHTYSDKMKQQSDTGVRSWKSREQLLGFVSTPELFGSGDQLDGSHEFVETT
ncbi:hypothetical protein KOR42_22190 [Thalassoglobus neptunius]|uniref:Insertion element IS402-like domain-containing protein n=1 Tax=Thalassoglobus neptunius TaxID=1938619 RepID=A0A5C5X950_9PLAN|nr:transposase [Thalassoglobus neptunius]TWT58833.1 hypothetical protein KOR42_22190 [Thalassoglobus neptunius]